jgi:hypothetical protein
MMTKRFPKIAAKIITETVIILSTIIVVAAQTGVSSYDKIEESLPE